MTKHRILELRPTQFVLGMQEVGDKTRKMRAMKKKVLKAYFDDHVIPVVIGPGEECYMIDHHHFARACWELGIEKGKVKVLEDKSDLTEKKFWNYLIKKNWTHLFDQFGHGPHSPLSLPFDIRSMADDPFRSLAWVLVEKGIVDKIDIPFYEFQWAGYLRRNLRTTLTSKSDFKEAIREAIKLASSRRASHLPGYRA